MKEPVILIQEALFTRNYNYRVVDVLTVFLQGIFHICGNWSAFVVTFWLQTAFAMTVAK